MTLHCPASQRRCHGRLPLLTVAVGAACLAVSIETQWAFFAAPAIGDQPSGGGAEVATRQKSKATVTKTPSSKVKSLEKTPSNNVNDLEKLSAACGKLLGSQSKESDTLSFRTIGKGSDFRSVLTVFPMLGLDGKPLEFHGAGNTIKRAMDKAASNAVALLFPGAATGNVREKRDPSKPVQKPSLGNMEFIQAVYIALQRLLKKNAARTDVLITLLSTVAPFTAQIDVTKIIHGTEGVPGIFTGEPMPSEKEAYASVAAEAAKVLESYVNRTKEIDGALRFANLMRAIDSAGGEVDWRGVRLIECLTDEPPHTARVTIPGGLVKTANLSFKGDPPLYKGNISFTGKPCETRKKAKQSAFDQFFAALEGDWGSV